MERSEALLWYRVSSTAPGQGLQVVLFKTTTVSELNKERILPRTLPRIEKFVLPPSVPVEEIYGYGTNTTTRHNWMRKERRSLRYVIIRPNPNKRDSCVAWITDHGPPTDWARSKVVPSQAQIRNHGWDTRPNKLGSGNNTYRKYNWNQCTDLCHS